LPKRIFTSTRIRWAALIFTCYWLLSAFSDPTVLSQFLVPVLGCIVVGVVLKYTPAAWEGVIKNDLGPVSQLAQGIWLAFCGLGLGLFWTWTARITHSDWMYRSPVVGFYLLCYIVAGSLHMTARRAPDGRVKTEDVRDVFIAYAAGLTISLVVAGLQLSGLLP
jgi:hypothetical protein